MSDSNVCSFCSRPSHLRETISCKTLCVSSCYNIIWAINNFSLIEKKAGTIISPAFLTGSNGTKWNLQLYPYGTESGPDKYVGLYLCNPNDTEKEINFTLSVLNKQRNKCSIRRAEKEKIGKKLMWGFPEFISREELFKTQSGLLPNDRLTISCELQVIDDLEESCSYKKNIGMEEVCQDVKQLLTCWDLSDVTISIGSNKYPAHKTILAARSPVFAATFNHDLLENRTKVIEVTDIEPKVMEQVLHYIYTGSCPEIKEMAADIIVAAEKYDLAGLKKLCEETLSELLNPENTAATLIAADLYNLKQLRDEALDYICKHIKEVHHTSGWNKMTESHPHLELEVLRAFAYRNTTIL